MESATYTPGEIHVLRLTHEEDLLNELTVYCNEQKIDAGAITVIGAVKDAKIGFYDQESLEYEKHYYNQPMELLQANGNVSFDEAGRFVHLHATFSDDDGSVVAGHVFEGTTMFAGEAMIHEIIGPDLKRQADDTTGLSLWEFDS